MRLFVTGTDTGVGKTRIAAALARAIGQATIVKLVQTGVEPGEPGDAGLAGALAHAPAREFARFRAAADPWSAALAEGAAPPRAAELCAMLDALTGPLVIEGSGGIAVPLNADETFGDVVRAARCEAIVVVGLRLGCISHALLTLAYLAQLRVPVRAAVLVETFGPVEPAYVAHVTRVLRPRCAVVAIPYEIDDRAGVDAAAQRLAGVV